MRYILLLLLVSCGVTSKQGSNSNKQKIERNYFNDSIVAIEKFYKNLTIRQPENLLQVRHT